MKCASFAFVFIFLLSWDAEAVQLRSSCEGTLDADLQQCESVREEELLDNSDQHEECLHGCTSAVCRDQCDQDMHYRGYLIEEFEHFYCIHEAYDRFEKCPRLALKRSGGLRSAIR